MLSASSATQKVQDKYAVASVKSRTASLPQSESEGCRIPLCAKKKKKRKTPKRSRRSAFPTCRLHSARQRPPGGRPAPRLPAGHDPEGEERRREPVGLAIWQRPKQRQVLQPLTPQRWFAVRRLLLVNISCVFCFSSETESDACKANGRSEEQLQTPGSSSTSTDSSFGDGEFLSVLLDVSIY